MNILLINQPLNNRGDESAHKGLVRSLLQSLPDVNIQVLFVAKNQDSINQFSVNDPRVVYTNIQPGRGYAKIWKFALKRNFPVLFRFHPTTRKILHCYKKAQYVICAPGGICMGGFQNWEHLLMLLFAKYLKKPLAYYGRSIGPFPTETKEQNLFKKISIEMLKYFSFFSIRDKRSEVLADELNVKYVSTVDSAFLDSPKVEIPSEIKELIGEGPYIVFVPNLLIWHYRYKGKVSKNQVMLFYSRLLERINKKYSDCRIVLLPQTFNYFSYDGDDVRFFYDFADFVKKDNVVVIPDKYSSDVQQTIISSSACVIGARYHSIVFAINQARPFVALSYEHKIAGLLETLQKEKSMVDISETFESDVKMQATIELFSQKLNEIDSDIVAKTKAKSIALNCLGVFLDWIRD